MFNFKRACRVRREEGLQVRKQMHRKRIRPRTSMLVPESINEYWSVDFVPDQLADARQFRIQKIIDEHSRESVPALADFLISRNKAGRELELLTRKLRKTRVCDNGPEFTSNAYFLAKNAQVKLHCIQSGKPTRNAFAEICNGKLRDYCFYLNQFASLEDVRQLIEFWKTYYKHVRPLSLLGKKTPTVQLEEAAWNPLYPRSGMALIVGLGHVG